MYTRVCFIDLKQNKTKTQQSPVIIFLNKEDLFDITLYKGYSLRMCFDGRSSTWIGANTEESIYNGPDFDPNYDFANDPDNILTILNNSVTGSSIPINTVGDFKHHWFQHCKLESILFICRRFYAVSAAFGRELDRNLYIHVTCATSHNQVQNVFTNCVHHVILTNLVNSGLLPVTGSSGAAAAALAQETVAEDAIANAGSIVAAGAGTGRKGTGGAARGGLEVGGGTDVNPHSPNSLYSMNINSYGGAGQISNVGYDQIALGTNGNIDESVNGRNVEESATNTAENPSAMGTLGMGSRNSGTLQNEKLLSV